MKQEGTGGYAGGDQPGATTPDPAETIRVPGLMLLLPRGPWSAQVEVREVATAKSRTRKRMAVLRHHDGRVALEDSEAECWRLQRIADSLNGWEQSRWFPPDHPERWRMQGKALPKDPARALLDEACGLLWMLLRGARVQSEAEAFLHGLEGLAQAQKRGSPFVPGQRPDLPGQQPLGGDWPERA